MQVVQRSNYLIYFDDVRVDNYVISWNAQNGLFANNASASITMFRTDKMDKWKSYLTQVRIFGENPFTQKFTMLFEGEVSSRSWRQNKSNMGTVTFQAKGFYHWLDIPVPLGIQSTEELSPLPRILYEAQNINIEEVRELMLSQSEILLKDKNIEEIIESLYEKLMIGYYDVTGANTAFAFAKIKERFKVMVDVMEEFRASGFLDLFTFTQVTQIDSFYVYLNDVLSQMMFEFYQDRDGSFRIKVPSWSESVLKAHVLDASIIADISGLDDWEQEPTRVLAIGAETQMMESQGATGTIPSQMTIPIGLYIGNPQDPSTEEYYSQQVQHYLNMYGVSPHDIGYGTSGPYSSDTWFDNLGNYTITSRHKSENSARPTHEGVDFNFTTGTPVYNIGTFGVVQSAGFHSTMGYYVTVRQTVDGLIHDFRYMHFNEMPMVQQGQSVSPGQQLGRSGNTGNSQGAHLHLEVWKGGVGGTSINPIPFLASKRMASTTNPALPGNAKEFKISYTGGSAAYPWESNPYTLTSYNALCPPVTIDGRYYEGCTGITRTGLDVRDSSYDYRVIAVDPAKIPLHSIVEIEGLGLFNALDTGGAIKGNRIDVLATSYEEAMKFGKQTRRVRVLRRGEGDGSMIPFRKVGSSGGTTSTSSSTYSSSYANVDGPRSVAPGFKMMSTSDKPVKNEPTVKENTSPKATPVTYGGEFTYPVPSYGTTYSSQLSKSPNGVDGNLIASIITHTSAWREKSEVSGGVGNGRVGLTGLPKNYVDDLLGGQNVLSGSNSIEFASLFLKGAMDHFNGKVTFALAAYHLGSIEAVEAITKNAGSLDFSKMRSQFGGTTDFVDKVIGTYASSRNGNYIKGDPHKSFGQTVSDGPMPMPTDDSKPQNAPATDAGLPDYDDKDRPKLSDEERRFKMNLKRVEQVLIRTDSEAIGGNALTADRLIRQYAKYMMQLYRARSHNINVSLTTCLPFLRPGLNAWLEPTRTDVVFYITSVQHQGAFREGCVTNIGGGFVRSPENYQDVDTSIFIGETRALSNVFGEQVSKSDMEELRKELQSMHDEEATGEAHSFSLLTSIYSSMNGTSEYATQWNKELTIEEIDNLINSLYAQAPDVVVERKNEIASIISDSENIFLEKLLFTRG